MLQRLVEDDAAKKQTCGLVLVPTRRAGHAGVRGDPQYAKGLGITVLPVYGGAPISQQIRTLERGAGSSSTPGRALDHIKRGTLKLGSLRCSSSTRDEMLDMGLRRIRRNPRGDPEDAADGAVLGDHAGEDPVDRAAAPAHPARVIVAREKTAAGKTPRVRQMPTSCRAPTNRPRSTACSTWRTRPRRSSSAAPGWRSRPWSKR
jgi:ATP-dependent RNA helicase DeaD